ncbi:MAG: rod shape-determining protein MreD [Lachnospiraceae bacterium]|nr:rod shape-determining protein MreD [Lachnospiraceae bacterium]MDD3659318.1 rod shape-determining protein MreD [Lachnospiraceae bacterium]
MRKNITIGLMIIICFTLQNVLFRSITFGGIGPNLMVVLTSSFGFMRGKKNGMIIGFFSGLFMDIFFGSALGLYALIYMYIGYTNGAFHKIFYPQDIKLPLILIAGSDLALNLITYCLLFLLRGRFHFVFYLSNIILPEIVYTIAVTIILYPIILLINKTFDQTEKRSDQKFV